MTATDDSGAQSHQGVVPAFNGGKMAHIFHFDDETRMYSPREASEDAIEVLRNGRLFYKIDGCNGMILRDANDNLVAFQRLDTRGRPIPDHCISLPAGLNVDTCEGHSYCYEPITLDVCGKKAKKRNKAMLVLVENHKDRFIGFVRETTSIEWVGAKFNKTPGVPHDVAIAIHSEQTCEEEIDRSYEGMRSFLLEIDPPIEGLIVELKGSYWKIRADCFDNKCRYKTDKSADRRPPVFLS